MTKTRTPSLATPLKAAQLASSSFQTKIRDHAAIQADPLLQAQAVWVSRTLEDFSTLVEQRAQAAQEQGNG